VKSKQTQEPSIIRTRIETRVIRLLIVDVNTLWFRTNGVDEGFNAGLGLFPGKEC